jgi:hypothetical protein
MTLTDQERDKFATYLEAQARDNLALIKQMKKLPGTSLEDFAKPLRRDVAAFTYVAVKLRAVESMTIEEETP